MLTGQLNSHFWAVGTRLEQEIQMGGSHWHRDAIKIRRLGEMAREQAEIKRTKIEPWALLHQEARKKKKTQQKRLRKRREPRGV